MCLAGIESQADIADAARHVAVTPYQRDAADVAAPAGIDWRNAVFISAQRSQWSAQQNADTHKDLGRRLRAANFEFAPVRGVYNGVAEDSYIVANPDGMNAQKREGILLSLARFYGQESVLFIDAGDATLFFLSEQRSQYIGRMSLVNVQPMIDHTALPDGSYLIVK